MTCEEEAKAKGNSEKDEIPESEKNALESEEKDRIKPKEQVISKRYIGESHRSGGERQQEHAYDYRKKKEDSHMYMHLQESHPGKEPEEVKFGMTVLR